MLTFFESNAQERPIKVITEKIPNRLAFYAVNENEQDVDVMITIKGNNFRQSASRPRLIRLPGASKVHLKTIIVNRGKHASYTYDLHVSDSLSKRALKKEATAIKIAPPKPITIYITDKCTLCDSIVAPLNSSKYTFRMYKLSEHTTIKDQLKSSFARPLDSIAEPIVNIGGRLFTQIENYDQLLEELKKK